MADDVRALIRGSIDRAIADARARTHARASAEAARADVDKKTKAREAERQSVDALERSKPREGAMYRALQLAPPASEQASAEQMRAAQADTQRFAERLHGSLDEPTDEELYRLQTPPSMQAPYPPVTTKVDELGRHTAMSPEEVELAARLEAYARDMEIERELSAPMPPARPAPPPPVVGHDELGQPVRGTPLDPTKVRASRPLTADQESIQRQIDALGLVSDERAKVDIRPSMPDVAPAFRDGLGPHAADPLSIAPDAGRYLESTIAPGTTGIASVPGPRPGELRAEMNDAQRPVKDSGLAAGVSDDADRRKRALDNMEFMASMPQFEMVDVGGRYRG